jgi:hypothetical protein
MTEGHEHTPRDPRTFVFGSNMMGVHGAGAARYACNSLGAKYGVGLGPTGRCYALPTCSRPGVPLPLTDVVRYVRMFLDHAEAHPETEFFVSEVGCGLAGFHTEQIAPLFATAPNNCALPPHWERDPVRRLPGGELTRDVTKYVDHWDEAIRIVESAFPGYKAYAYGGGMGLKHPDCPHPLDLSQHAVMTLLQKDAGYPLFIPGRSTQELSLTQRSKDSIMRSTCATEMAGASDSPTCQACGESWETHELVCYGMDGKTK